MPGGLDPSVAAKLARVCGLLSSDHDGERSAAAWQATKLLQAHGLSWSDVFVPPRAELPAALAPHGAEARWALRFHDRLTAWERKFLADIGWRHRISAKQAAALDGIVCRLREGRG